ncbi:MAG: phosphoribosylformylglycinamidine synthase I [Candidatus Levybacteria bacterium RIFCSPHIGHO2_01_FULL_40_15b]|nr:MAG: phosphoribosylformylglycinamidine synthase I [Candidatus Levybacteria bacterium RIFCSPHIGHO2_01_FULL_40_15b]
MSSEILKPKVAVLKAPGINCDVETSYGFELAGAAPETILVEDLKSGERKLSDYQIVALSGGFSYGDDLGSGKVLALELDTYLGNQIQRFIESGLMIGICNGFQILVRSGLLPMGTLGEQKATLDRNDSGKFISRRINLSIERDNACVFLQDLKTTGPVEFQVAHGEGKFVADSSILSQIEESGQVVFRYVDRTNNPTQEYPLNPNGSPHAIAGIADPSGRILGLMPHPERSIDRYQYPNEDMLPDDFVPEGLQIFQGMVQYAKEGV